MYPLAGDWGKYLLAQKHGDIRDDVSGAFECCMQLFQRSFIDISFHV